MKRSNIDSANDALIASIPNAERLELFTLLRPSEIEQVKLRRAFLTDRDRIRKYLKNNPEVENRDISVAVGYQPDTLTSAISDAMVLRQRRYNLVIVARVIRHLGMRPTSPLDAYLDAHEIKEAKTQES